MNDDEVREEKRRCGTVSSEMLVVVMVLCTRCNFELNDNTTTGIGGALLGVRHALRALGTLRELFIVEILVGFDETVHQLLFDCLGAHMIKPLHSLLEPLIETDAFQLGSIKISNVF